MAPRSVTLDEKYDLSADRIFVSGTQAVVRLTLMQQARDAALGKHTAGYVTGYRGSPLGGLDQQFARAGKRLSEADVLFQPALNEDLAATLYGAPSRRSCAAPGGMTASSASGTARGPAPTARATPSATPTLPAPRHGEACSP